MFTQHKPILSKILDQFKLNNLKKDFKLLEGSPKTATKKLVVFVMGGVTYEEAACVAAFNLANANKFSVVVGGSTMLNSQTFLQACAEA